MKLTGVQAMLLSAFCFALMNLCVRMLPRIPAHEAVFFRALGMTAIGAVLLWRARIPPLGRHRKALVLRSLFGMTALTAYFYPNLSHSAPTRARSAWWGVKHAVRIAKRVR